jgi:hypothetical protein
MVLPSKIRMMEQKGATSFAHRNRAGHDIREQRESAAMNRVKTAVLWGQDDLLAEAIKIFFKKEPGWQVIWIPPCSGLSSLVAEVQKARPELVIICHSNVRDGADPFLKLIQEQPELSVIAGQPELKVITVSLTDNAIQVYSKHTVTVRSVSDLLSLIEDGSFSFHTMQKEVTRQE